MELKIVAYAQVKPSLKRSRTPLGVGGWWHIEGVMDEGIIILSLPLK
jgi:hypothetical protein